MSERIEHMELLLSEELGELWEVRVMNQVASTMDAARELLPLSQGKAGLVLALRQTAGRGRQGRVWRAAREGLYVTFVWQAPAQIARLSAFSLAVGCVLRRALAELGAEVKLKWPNDILACDGRKLSGTLIELVSQAGVNHILCGIGINLCDAPGPASEVVSLQELSGKTFSALEIAKRVAPQLSQALTIYLNDGFKSFVNDWNLHAFGIGNICQLEVGDRLISGALEGVDSEGRIVLNSGGGSEAFAVGQLVGSQRC